MLGKTLFQLIQTRQPAPGALESVFAVQKQGKEWEKIIINKSGTSRLKGAAVLFPAGVGRA